MRRTFLGLTGAGLVALALAAMPAQAQSLPPVGTVDMSRINQEYQAMSQLMNQYESFVGEQQTKFDNRLKTRMLNDAELKEYMDLSQFGAPTEANKQKLDALAQTSEAREKELRDLTQKTRSADEQKRYDELNAIATARGAELAKLRDELTDAVNAKGNEIRKVIFDSVNAAIKSVAEQKKLSLVIAKSSVFTDPDNGVAVSIPNVLYGGTDVTEEVLAKLNAAPAATSGKPAAAPAPASSKPAAAPAPTSSTPAAGTTAPPSNPK